MAKEMLAALPLSNNDIRVLARLLKHKYEDCLSRRNRNPIDKHYMRHLVRAVGLGFTAIVEDGGFVSPMQTQLNHFLIYFDLIKKDESFATESLSAARILSQGAFLFHRLQYPDYYEVFKTTLQEILGSGFEGSEKRRGEASRLVSLLLTH